jgi:hypothetical protein
LLQKVLIDYVLPPSKLDHKIDKVNELLKVNKGLKNDIKQLKEDYAMLPQPSSIEPVAISDVPLQPPSDP